MTMNNIPLDTSNQSIRRAAPTFSSNERLCKFSRANIISPSTTKKKNATSCDLPPEINDPLIRVQRSGATVIQRMVMSMMAFPLEAKFQESACSVLAEWSSDDFYRVVIGSAGGITAIVNAMRTNIHHLGIQSKGCLALGFLSTKSKRNRAAIRAAYGKEVILQARHFHPYSEIVQANARFALQRIEANISCNGLSTKLTKTKVHQVPRDQKYNYQGTVNTRRKGGQSFKSPSREARAA